MAQAVVPEPSREQASQAGETLPRFERPAAVHGGRFMIGYAVIVVMVLAALLTIGFMSRGESSSTTAAGGLTTEEIASAMFVSVNTIRTHVRSILRKLGVSRRNAAVRRARDLSLLPS